MKYAQDFNPVTLVTHRTPESVVGRFFSLEGEAMEEVMIGGVTLEGEEVPDISAQVMVDGVRRMGLWGFADLQEGEIHYWLDPWMRDTAMVVHFFAHELEHLHAGQWSDPDLDEDLQEELRCEHVGRLAAYAYELVDHVTSPCPSCDGGTRLPRQEDSPGKCTICSRTIV